jgi:hypothetical protein
MKMADEEILGEAVDDARDEGDEDDVPMAAESSLGVDPPATVLPVILGEDVGGLVVALIGSAPDTPDLEEVIKMNSQESSKTKTPLMTVIKAVLRGNGGRMAIKDLAEAAQRSWMRPFPTSPYTREEFIFMMTRNSDSLKIESPPK